MGAYNAITADNNADRGAGIGSAAGTLIGAALGGPIGAAIGGFLGDFAGRFIGEHWEDITNAVGNAWDAMADWFSTAWDDSINWLKDIWSSVTSSVMGVVSWFKDTWNSITNTWNKITNWFSEKWNSITKAFGSAVDGFMKFVKNPWGAIKEGAKGAFNYVKDLVTGEGHAAGGIVGTKDNVVGVAKGEIILSKTMQENLVSILKNPMIAAKPVGQNDFTYKPGNTEISKVGDSTITVKDFNINLGGTIRLDAGSSSANINMNELMRDPVFMNKMKGIIEESVSKSYYGGRKMNDLASKRGMFVQSGTIGRRS
jgi:phage-related protein